MTFVNIHTSNSQRIVVIRVDYVKSHLYIYHHTDATVSMSTFEFRTIYPAYCSTDGADTRRCGSFLPLGCHTRDLFMPDKMAALSSQIPLCSARVCVSVLVSYTACPIAGLNLSSVSSLQEGVFYGEQHKKEADHPGPVTRKTLFTGNSVLAQQCTSLKVASGRATDGVRAAFLLIASLRGSFHCYLSPLHQHTRIRCATTGRPPESGIRQSTGSRCVLPVFDSFALFWNS